VEQLFAPCYFEAAFNESRTKPSAVDKPVPPSNAPLKDEQRDEPLIAKSRSYEAETTGVSSPE
jgi:hypothetical protein